MNIRTQCILPLVILLTMIAACGDKRYTSPGDETKTLLEEDFEHGPLDMESTWHLEGTGNASIDDGRLALQEDSAGIGVVLWLRRDFPSDVALSFDLSFSNNRGIGVFFAAATGPEQRDALTGTAPRTGAYDEYTRGDLYTYGFSLHRYFPDGRNNPGANLRKHPGFHLLSAANPDPTPDADRIYRISFAKTGARLVLRVDGDVVHDYIDDSEPGPAYGRGKVGFRLRGHHSCVMWIDNLVIQGNTAP